MATALQKLYTIEDRLGFVCTGSSGAIVAGIVSSLLPDYMIEIIHIKKSGEQSHGSLEWILSNYSEYKFIIIDDFIDSGKTVNRIFKRIDEEGGKVDCLCVTDVVRQSQLEFIPNNVICKKYKPQ